MSSKPPTALPALPTHVAGWEPSRPVHHCGHLPGASQGGGSNLVAGECF